METRAKNIRKEVMRLLGLSEEQYYLNVLEYSYDFLQAKGYNVAVVDVLHQTPAYWVWWRNQFGIADMFFLNSCRVFALNRYSPAQLHEFYKQSHVGIMAFPGTLVEKIQQLQTIKK